MWEPYKKDSSLASTGKIVAANSVQTYLHYNKLTDFLQATK
jgi:hypothetical protein